MTVEKDNNVTMADSLNVRDDRANVRDERGDTREQDQRDSRTIRDGVADARDKRADDREKDQHGAMAWLFGVLVVIGILLVITTIQSSRATDRLSRRVDQLNVVSEQTVYDLRVGRYERIVFQRDQRRLTCLDLQDGDTGATSAQYEECDKDYIPSPKRPTPPKKTS